MKNSHDRELVAYWCAVLGFLAYGFSGQPLWVAAAVPVAFVVERILRPVFSPGNGFALGWLMRLLLAILLMSGFLSLVRLMSIR